MADISLTDIVKEAGIVGAGGAGFPTHVKLGAQVECFIVNAAECEPLIEVDKYLCRTFPERIVKTISIIAGELGAGRKVIALKGKYKAEIKALEMAIRSLGSDVEIFELDYFYPAGDEQTIIHQVTNVSIPERGLPSDVGCVVDNVGTVLNIADALDGKPVTEKYLSVVGEVENTIVLKVPVGTGIADCINEAKPLLSDYSIILGGPMMGKCLYDMEDINKAVVTKTTGNIMVLPKSHYLFKRASLSLQTIRRQTKSACIQCRMCTDLCPRYLIGHEIKPHRVMRGFWKEETVSDNDEYVKLYGSAINCCSCGICEMFACPMGLSPRKVNDYAKGEMRKRGINIERNLNPKERQGVSERKIPTNRLVSRLGLSKYYGRKVEKVIEYTPESVSIPCSQHIGKPAIPSVKAGDTVNQGDIIARASEGLSANIHSSIDGVVENVTEATIYIRRKGEK